MSLRSVSRPNLLKTLPDLLLSLFWLRRTLLVCPLALTEADVWERATLILRLAPIYWVLTTAWFSLVRFIRLTIGFLPVRLPLEAFRFSPIRCKRGVRYPLVALFLLVLVEIEPKGECSGLQQVSQLVYEDFRVSHLFDGPGRASCVAGLKSLCPVLGALRWPLFVPQ